MKIRTEFIIDLQTTRDEELYMKKVHDIVDEIIPEDFRISGRNLRIEYIPTRRRNLVAFTWNIPESVGKGKEKPYLDSMASSIRGTKWLRRHNVNNIAHIYM